jgi:signal transduction histidine kinase/transcriptional regulator with GAF, ATPase, and Fis domain
MDESAETTRIFSTLNQAATLVNHLGMSDSITLDGLLNLVVNSIICIVPGSCAVLYLYDSTQGEFLPSTRVVAGERNRFSPSVDLPRPNGLGRRAIERQRRVLIDEEVDLEVPRHRREEGVQTYVAFPLIVARRVIGVLYVYRYEKRPWSFLELFALENFANQAAMAIYHARRVERARQDIWRRDEELEHLRRASLLISSRPRLEETLETILQMALEVTNAEYGSFRLVDAEGHYLLPSVVVGKSLRSTKAEKLPIDENSIMGWVARHRQPLCIHDVREEPWVSIYSPLDPELSIRSELAVPLIGASGRLEGVLNLESPVPGGFSEEDSHLVQALANQAVIAIQEVKLLDALQEISESLLVESRDEALHRLVVMACQLLNASTGAMWLVEGATLRLVAAKEGQQHSEELPINQSLIGRAVLSMEPVISANVPEEVWFHRPELARAQGWQRALVVPLIDSREHGEPVAIGAFAIYSTQNNPGNFIESDWDKKVMTILARYATLAVKNAARQEAMRAAHERQMLSETFAALGDVAANLLHQMNNKIGAIPVRIESLQEKRRQLLETDVYLAQILEEIKETTRNTLNTLRESLILLHPIQPSAVDILNCVRGALHAVDLPPRLEVRLEGLELLPPVRGSEPTLRLVFQNLIENARDALHGRDHGVIIIRGRVDSWGVEIQVSDNGPGIPPELQERIFELNFSSQKPTHIGFGLWWVKTLVTRLSGSVKVRSDKRQGTTFFLHLPILSDYGDAKV